MKRAMVVVFFVLAGSWLSPGSATESIRIGAFLAVTGSASFLGEPQSKTLKLYVDKINADGGVLGRRLDLTTYDTQGDARQALTFVRRLIEEDKVDFLIGGTTTGETMAVAPIVEQSSIPLISLAGGNVVVEPVKKWIFKTAGSDRMAVQRVYQDMKQRKFVTIGVLSGAGGFDQSCLVEAKALASKYGIAIVAEEKYATADADMMPQLTRLSAANPDAVLSCGFGSPTVLSVRNYRQLRIKAPLYFTHGVGSQQFVDGAQGAANGVRVPVAAILVWDQLPADDVQGPVVRRYFEQYSKAYGQPPSAFGGFAYDALFMMVDAIKRARSSERAAVRDQIEQTAGFVGIDGIFNLTPMDHMGLTSSGFRMSEIQGNAWKLIP